MIEDVDQDREDDDGDRRRPGKQAYEQRFLDEILLIPGGERQVDGGEEMRADAKQSWQPEKPPLISADDARVRFLWQRICRDDAEHAVVERRPDPEPRAEPAVEAPVEQRQEQSYEQKNEVEPTFAIDHQADPEFAPLIVEEQ